MEPTPQIFLKGPATSVRYAWVADGGSIYVADTADAGLCWELLSWKDGV